jgi:hypothetical protein
LADADEHVKRGDATRAAAKEPHVTRRGNEGIAGVACSRDDPAPKIK